ncbi:MAG: CAP domain-containing protein [Candidatus Roizmanbacteria bacterium]|nr:CAP domain-containing protein [Candidatus Roizmanbacteria bacterium]
MNFLLNKIRHFFIPREENNYHAHSLHTSMLSVYLLVAIMLVFVSKNVPSFSNVLGVATDISIPKLLTLTNEERTKLGLPALQSNNQLTQAAEKKAADMFKKDYWSHFAPDGGSPWDFIKQSGYQYEYAGENLAKNFLYSKNVVDAWMNSPTHKENIVKKDYTEVGYAVVNGMLGGEETTLVVQMFGAPLNKTMTKTEQVPESTQKDVPVVQEVQKPAVLGQSQKQAGVVNGKHLAYDINIVFIAFIAGALLLDFTVASKLNILHLRGKHLAHLLFLGFISLGILLILKQGAIL